MTPTGFQLRFEELKPGTARELLFLTKFLLSFLAVEAALPPPPPPFPLFLP